MAKKNTKHPTQEKQDAEIIRQRALEKYPMSTRVPGVDYEKKYQATYGTKAKVQSPSTATGKAQRTEAKAKAEAFKAKEGHFPVSPSVNQGDISFRNADIDRWNKKKK